MQIQDSDATAPVVAPRRAHWVRRLATHLLVLAVGTVVGLLLGEGLVRLVMPQFLEPPLSHMVNGVMHNLAGISGWSSIPKLWNVSIHINAQGLRGQTDYPAERRPGTLRILTLGDSYTFGIGADDEQAYPARLELILNQRLRGGASAPSTARVTGVEVLNGGVWGTGVGNHVLLYDEGLKAYHPDVVVLGIVVNDVGDDLRSGLFQIREGTSVEPRPLEARAKERPLKSIARSMPAYAFLAQHSHLLNLIRYRVTQALVEAQQKSSSPKDDSSSQVFRVEGLTLLAGEIRWLRTKVRDSGAVLVVFFMAPPDSDPRADAVVETLAETCRQEGIPFADSTAFMKDQQRQSSRPLYYTPADIHPTPDGYQDFAEFIARFLIAENLVPPQPTKDKPH
jgi:lysophospholipase L1-like esterase